MRKVAGAIGRDEVALAILLALTVGLMGALKMINFRGPQGI